MNFMNVNSLFPVTWNEVSAVWYEIRIQGLKQTESEQDQTCANAALLMGRVLFTLEERMEFVVSELESMTQNGWAPAEAMMLVGIAEEDEPILSVTLAELQEKIAFEYRGAHEGLAITMKKEEPQALPALHPVDLQKAVFFLMQLPDGVQKMSGIENGRAETICHLEGVQLLPDGLQYDICIGSSVNSAGKILMEKICYLAEFLGGESSFTGTDFSEL